MSNTEKVRLYENLAKNVDFNDYRELYPEKTDYEILCLLLCAGKTVHGLGRPGAEIVGWLTKLPFRYTMCIARLVAKMAGSPEQDCFVAWV